MSDLEPQLVCSPREAFLGPTRHVPLTEAPGEIAAEMISPYPPGIPVVAPGERFTQPMVDFLQKILQMGIAIPDASDPSLKQIRVVA
jgi:arginine/lysine/ornithine decarboxylase